MLLAIDTSTDFASIALWEGGGVLAEQSWRSGRNHTRDLLPAIDTLLQRLARPIGAVEAIAVALGPGSYSGLRVGVSTAKGLALALRCPIAGVPTPAVQSYGCAAGIGVVWAVLPGGGRELAAASYTWQTGRWTEQRAPHLATPEQLISDIDGSPGGEPVILCGEMPASFIALLRERITGRITVAPAALNVRRAGWLAALAAERLDRGEQDDVAQLEPIYLRRPSITPPRASTE